MVRSDRFLDNPLNWSFRIGRLFDVDIRIHILFLVGALVLLSTVFGEAQAAGLPAGSLIGETVGLYVLLFVVVLLHEFGHCFGARFTGGSADEILLWPLGGLAYTEPPFHPRAHLITTICGPMVNVAFCAVCSAVLILWTGSFGAVPWNPFHPTSPIDPTVWFSEPQRWVVRLFAVSYVLLLFNLMPVFPLDGGRVVQALLWYRRGYRRSLLISTGVGMVGAALLGLIGLFTSQSWLVLMVAVYGYLTCWQQRRALLEEGPFGEGGYESLYEDPYAQQAAQRRPGFFARRRAMKAARKREQQRRRAEERARLLDEVLRKVSQTGLQSLTPGEKRLLEEETQRRRMEQDEEQRSHMPRS